LSDDTREIITFTEYGESPEISDWDDLIDDIEEQTREEKESLENQL